MSWQGNPNLVKHRVRLVANSLRNAYHEAEIIPYAAIAIEAEQRMEESFRADGRMICNLVIWSIVATLGIHMQLMQTAVHIYANYVVVIL